MSLQYDKFLPTSATPTTVLSPEKQEKTPESKKREKKASTQSKT
jgi:hypothetical protein